MPRLPWMTGRPISDAAASRSAPPSASLELSTSTWTPLASATWPRSASRPSLTSIIAVAPSSAASGPASYGGAGRRCAATSSASGSDGGSPPGARPAASPPAGGRGRPRSGRAARPRPPGRPAGRQSGAPAAARQVAECGHRQDHQVGARRVAADDARARPGRLRREPVRQVGGPAGGQRARRGQRDEQRRVHRAHRRDVGQAARGGLHADVVRRGPVAAEMPALDQQVDRRDHAARRRADHRGVVADADRGQRARGHAGPQGRDHPEFPQVRDGPLITSDLAASTHRAAPDALA